jgi:hypothetical protein
VDSEITLFTNGNFNCSSIANLLEDKLIQGNFSCPSSDGVEGVEAIIPGGLSSSAKIGIGVGLGIGIPLLIVVATLAFIYHRQLSGQRLSLAAETTAQQTSSCPKIYELPGSRRFVTTELPGSRRYMTTELLSEGRAEEKRPVSELP